MAKCTHSLDFLTNTEIVGWRGFFDLPEMTIANELSLTWRITPDLIGVLNRDGYFELSNPAWFRTLGWTEEDLRTTPFFDFLHPDDLERNVAAFDAIQHGIPALKFENRYRSKSGDYHWLSWVAVPEGDKFYCSARDITEEKAKAENLIKRTAERDRMWRLSQDLLVIATTDGLFEAANAAWMTILGWEPDDLLGRSFIEFAHPDDLPYALKEVEAILSAPLTRPYEYRLRHKDGSYRSIAWTASYEDGKIYANGRDTTLERQNAEALTAEQASSRLREQLIAVLGHDLRNPLASISAATRMLLAEGQNPRSQEILSLASGSVNRMSALIDNVLDFARGSLGGGISLSRSDREPLEPFLRQVADELQIGTDHTIETHFEINEPVTFDRSRIGQLVSNLLGNALTHGACDIPIRFHAATNNGVLTLWISNGGDSIPPHVMEKLFQPFFRGEATPSQQGLGLGLFIASEIAKAHGGTLSAKSDENETRFTFTMPTEPDQTSTP